MDPGLQLVAPTHSLVPTWRRNVHEEAGPGVRRGPGSSGLSGQFFCSPNEFLLLPKDCPAAL